MCKGSLRRRLFSIIVVLMPVIDSKEGEITEIETISVEQLSQELKDKGEEVFRRYHPHPYMFLLATDGMSDRADFLGPKTIQVSADSLLNEEKGMPEGERVVAVHKTHRNVFKSKITVGRAKNNDIIIRASKISKLHAAFLMEGEDSYSLVDMGSTNGTKVNNVRLKKNEPVRVRNKDVIMLWHYVFEFVDIDTFIRHLKENPS